MTSAVEAGDGSNGENEIVPQEIAILRELLGDVEFLPCNQGEGGKGPIIPRFQDLVPASMTAGHIAQCERPDYRIGFLFGENSGGLCGLDCDCDAFAVEMLRFNPWLARTLMTTCNRGCTYWLRLTDCWPKKETLYWRGEKVGEWRADGHQSVIAGQDTATKLWRRFIAKTPTMQVPWRVILWLEEMEFGGEKTRHPWPRQWTGSSPFK